MTTTETRIVAAALALAPETRASLAEQLLESLESGSEQPQIDAAWQAEITARIKAHENGEMAAIPAEQVFRDLGLPSI